MANMFYQARAFNQAIKAWDTGRVVDMRYMFYEAAEFNQQLDAWDTSSVTDMSSMFCGATSFNAYIGSWNTMAVANMTAMFAQASGFDQASAKPSCCLMRLFWESALPFESEVHNRSNKSLQHRDDGLLASDSSAERSEISCREGMSDFSKGYFGLGDLAKKRNMGFRDDSRGGGLVGKSCRQSTV